MNSRNNKYPLVSVIATCYNHSKFLQNTLDSILKQTYQNIQLIIIDDFSQDDSKEKIDFWLKKNHIDCIFIAHKKNTGICKSLNEAISYSTGKYIQFISCDDVLLKQKLEKQVEIFEKKRKNNLAIVYSDMKIIDVMGDTVSDSYFSHYSIDKSNLPRGFIYESALENNLIPAPSMLIDKEKLERIGLFDESLTFEDLDFILRATKLFEVDYILDSTVNYRIHESSMSRNITRGYIESHLKLYEKHVISSTESQKSKILRHLNVYSIIAYEMGVPKSSKWLKYRILYSGGWHNYIYYIFSWMGINFYVSRIIIKLIEKIKRKVSSISIPMVSDKG